MGPPRPIAGGGTPRAPALLLLLVTGCGHTGPREVFPPVGPLSPSSQVELVRSRPRGIRTLWARVQAAVDSRELSGSLEIICIFERPGGLHLSAFRGLILSARPVLELTFSPRSYHLVLHGEEGQVDESRGSLENFPVEHPEMAALFWLREAMFLPGEVERVTALPGAGVATDLRFRGETRDGARVEHRLDPETLAVLSTRLAAPGDGGEFEIRYPRYRAVGEVILPWQVEIEARDRSFRMEAAVLELEVNGAIEDEVFTDLEPGDPEEEPTPPEGGD